MLKVASNNIVVFLLAVIGAVVAAMFAVGDSFLESDGNAVQVGPLDADLEKGQLAYVNAWLGIASARAESGEDVALDISSREYQLIIPDGFEPAKGDFIYITTENVANHIPADNAYSNSSGGGKILLGKCSSDPYEGPDEENVVNVVLLVK